MKEGASLGGVWVRQWGGVNRGQCFREAGELLENHSIWKLQCRPRSQQVCGFYLPSPEPCWRHSAGGEGREGRGAGTSGASLAGGAPENLVTFCLLLRTMCCSVCGFPFKWFLLLYLLIPSYIFQSLKLNILFLYFLHISFCNKITKNEEFSENHFDCNPH